MSRIRTFPATTMLTRPRFSLTSSANEEEMQGQDNLSSVVLPPFICSPVFKQVYPSLLRHMEQYGNPNIPLGTVEGRLCKTLRRLAFEQKLNDQEIQWLTEMNFRFRSFEEVYEEADFDTCLTRLVQYEQEHQNGFQIPKKYPQDPELGAWVTMIRRIGRDNVPQDRREKLDNVGFAWVSSRKCGSAFMKNFRPIKNKLEACCRIHPDSGEWEVVNEDGIQAVLQDESIVKWLKAQRDAAANGNLVQARCDYLDQLPGIDWRSL